MARFLEQGKSLYGDVVEVNFPIIYYSKLIPNFFADLFSIEEVIATEIFHILLGLFSYFCCLNIIQNYTKNKFFQILLISAIGFVIFILPYGIYRNQFGQKEFYFVILTLPYVIFRIFYIGKDENQTSSNFRFFIGFVAGLGVCTKPYFIIPFALFEIYCLVRTKSIKKYFSQAELLGCALSGISFLIIFMLFFFDDYYNHILPIIKYTYYTHSHFDAIYFERIFLKESIIFLLLIYYFKDNYHLLLPIALLHVGSFFITMIQHRSIDSVKYLMYSFEIIFLAIICFCALSRIYKNKNFIIPIITFILVGFSIFKIINNLHDNIELEQNNIKPNHEDFNNYLASLESDNIFMLAPRLGVAFPAYLNLNINWNWNYSAFWTSPKKFYIESKEITEGDLKNIRKIEGDAIYSALDSIRENKAEYIIFFPKDIFDSSAKAEDIKNGLIQKIQLKELFFNSDEELKNIYHLMEVKEFFSRKVEIYQRVSDK